MVSLCLASAHHRFLYRSHRTFPFSFFPSTNLHVVRGPAIRAGHGIHGSDSLLPRPRVYGRLSHAHAGIDPMSVSCADDALLRPDIRAVRWLLWIATYRFHSPATSGCFGGGGR